MKSPSLLTAGLIAPITQPPPPLEANPIGIPQHAERRQVRSTFMQIFYHKNAVVDSPLAPRRPRQARGRGRRRHRPLQAGTALSTKLNVPEEALDLIGPSDFIAWELLE